MRLMRNKRTGMVAQYDESIVAAGTWEEFSPEPKPAVKAKARPKPSADAVIPVAMTGDLEVTPAEKA
jgi:hypothetical protein